VHREFCTLFDSNYVSKALAMYRSLERHCPDFRLTAFCFDPDAERLLGELDLPRLSTVSLAELEAFDAELLSVKDDRTQVEYCWTSTPALPLYQFAARPELDEVTYLDADLMFFSDPEPLFAEMGDASVLITPHRYAPQYRHLEVAGIYNVQFVTFRRTPDGLECLQWWHDRCIEWCYFRFEDGKIGDQKYLDDWPERFNGIHVLEHKGGGVAPWNIRAYEIEDLGGGRVGVDGEELVFFHYHGVKQLSDGRYDWRPPSYRVSRADARLVYVPYMRALDASLAELRAIEPEFNAGLAPPATLRTRIARRRVGLSQFAERRLPRLARRLRRSEPPVVSQ
jgi:hypothetical protein